MHLNTNFMLKEANRKMQANEARAATDAALRELRRHPSVRQRLARTLIGLATWLEPGSYPRVSAKVRAGYKPLSD